MSYTTPHHIPKYQILQKNFFVNYPFKKENNARSFKAGHRVHGSLYSAPHLMGDLGQHKQSFLKDFQKIIHLVGGGGW